MSTTNDTTAVTETDADLLDRAADLAEKVTAAATRGPWTHDEAFNASFVCSGPEDLTVAQSWILRLDSRPGRGRDKRDAAHIALWDPTVTRLIVTWLRDEAFLGRARGEVIPSAVAFARALLGESA